MVRYMMGIVPLGMGKLWILRRVYLSVSVHVMLFLPTLNQRLLSKKEKKKFTCRPVS